MPACVPRASAPTVTWPDTAFVLGGTGPYGKGDHVRKCLAFVQTLVEIGGWTGPVYILNDDRSGTLSFGRNQTTQLIKVPTIGKNTKSLIFNSSLVKESILIWNDCDVVVAQADCIAQRLGRIPLDFRRFDMYMANNEGVDTCKAGGVIQTRCGDQIHTGTFAAHRSASHAILREWQAQQRQFPGSLDRYTYYAAVQKLNGTANPPRIGRLPMQMLDTMWTNGTRACVNHLSKGRLKDPQTRRAAVDFIKSLCVEPAREAALLERLSAMSVAMEFARDVRSEGLIELKGFLHDHMPTWLG